VINRGRLDLLPDLWAQDLAWHGGSLGEVGGIDAYAKMLGGATASFRDLHLIAEDIFAAADKVVVRFTNGGLSTGPFLGAAPSGREVRWEGIGIYRLANGCIAEAWFSEDLLSLADQLGLIDLSAGV
jgi:predicted ester cyclase